VDTVLQTERNLNTLFPPDARYTFSDRNGKLQRQHTVEFAVAYHQAMNGMTERRLKQSIQAVAASWYTAWVNAGQPDLQQLTKDSSNTERKKATRLLNKLWMHEEMNY